MEIQNEPQYNDSVTIEKFTDDKGKLVKKIIRVNLICSCVDMICELDENDGDNASAGFKLSVAEGGQIVTPGTIHVVGPCERSDIKRLLKVILEEIDF